MVNGDQACISYAANRIDYADKSDRRDLNRYILLWQRDHCVI